MTESPDFAVLAQSIGETTIGYIGRERLRALAVEVDPRVNEASIEIVLRRDSEESRRAALEAVLEVGEIFWNEVVLSHSFVAELHDRERSLADSRRQYQFA